MSKVKELDYLGNLDIGDKFSGVYYVEDSFIRKTVQGKDFMDITLRDKTGSRKAKFWGVVPGIKKGDFALASGAVEDYRGNPSFVLANLESVDEPSDLSDYLPVYADADNLVDRMDVLRESLNKAAEKADLQIVGEIVDAVYGNGAFFNKLVTVPGSLAPHYGCQSGLLANVVRVGETAIQMASNYGLKPDEEVLVYAGAMLCMIGGVDAYGFENCMPVLTTNGQLLGVTNLTMIRVSTAAKRASAERSKAKTLKDTDGGIIGRLLHVIAASLNYGDEPVRPMTKEAIVVANAVRSDMEIVASLNFIENDQNGDSEFTAYDPVLRRRYFKG